MTAATRFVTPCSFTEQLTERSCNMTAWNKAHSALVMPVCVHVCITHVFFIQSRPKNVRCRPATTRRAKYCRRSHVIGRCDMLTSLPVKKNMTRKLTSICLSTARYVGVSDIGLMCHSIGLKLRHYCGIEMRILLCLIAVLTIRRCGLLLPTE